jgi:hypothetical protein
MDRKKAKQEYKQALQPMGIVRVRNLRDGRVFLMASSDTRGAMNSLRFQLKLGAFVTSPELARDWKELGEEAFAIEVLDVLKPVEDPDHDYRADLQVLEELWLERLQPYGDKGYHHPKINLRR